VLDCHFPCVFRDDINACCSRVVVLEIERRRCDLITQRQDSENRFYTSRRAQQMACR
jgi:hypothetical protein